MSSCTWSLRRWLLVVAFLATTVPPRTPLADERVAAKRAPLFDFDQAGRPIRLTKEGLDSARRVRDGFRRHRREFSGEFAGLDSVYHGLLMSRLMWNTARKGGGWGGHAMLYGPFGSAKSGLARFMMEREAEADAQFKLQMHQWITEQSIIGGQKMAEAEKGRVAIETKGSLSQAVVALMDETEKGNPSAFAPLLSVMNEGEVQVGETIKARLETLMATSNATPGELWRILKHDGQEATAGALLNRFHIKALMYNWLRPHEQAHLDRVHEMRLELGPLAHASPGTHGAHAPPRGFPMPLDEARLLSHYVIGLDPSFMPVYRELMDELRIGQNEAVRNSMAKFEDGDADEPFPYVPAGDMSERLRRQVPMMVRASAAADFWNSPLADDHHLEASLVKLPAFKLGPDSLWRSAFALTTIGRDRMRPRVQFTQRDKASFQLDWGDAPDFAQARDRRELKMLKNQESERTRFNTVLRNRLDAWQGNGGVLPDLSSLAPPGTSLPGSDSSQFELRLLKENGEL